MPHRALTTARIFAGLFLLILPLFFLTRVSTPAYAATNDTLNFQARLQKGAGQIAPDGNYNVRFKLYDASTGGTLLWTETRDYNGGSPDNRVRVANGYLSVDLGAITSFPSTIPWDQQLYLTMDIGGTGTSNSWDGEMSPRLSLTAVPYAFNAKTASELTTSSGANIATLSINAPTSGNQTFQIQDQGAAGTYNLLTDAQANANYIQNQTASTQTGNFNIQSANAASSVAVFQGASGQSVDYLQVKNSSGTKLFYIDSAGKAFFGGDIVSATTGTIRTLDRTVAGDSVAFTIRSGSTVSGNTGGFLIKSGDATGGNSGNIRFDVGTATGTLGYISFGDTNATDIRFGNSSSTNTFNGSSDFVGDATFQNTSGVAFNKGTDFSTTGASDDVNFGAGVLFRLTGASTQTINGIAGGTDGRTITLLNAGSAPAVLANNAGTSSAANRITTGTGANLNIPVGGSIQLIYDSGDSLWRVIGVTDAGANYVSLQGTTPGTAQAGNFNINGTGIAATLEGTTSVLTPYLDTASSASLTIGTTNASDITIGQSGVTTTVAGDIGITLNSTTGTTMVCLNGSGLLSDCDASYVAPTATNFIQNQSSSQQTGDYWISGTARADTSVLTPLLDTASATALNIGTTNATSINLNQDTVLAANKSITITGGATGTRPGSPTEGMLYYDTTTHQLLQYNGTKWQSDSKAATFIVAASNSSQAAKDGAQYVANGEDSAGAGIGTLDGDQIEINNALTAAAAAGGGTVYLAEGTYTIDGSISIPNNVTLAGSGNSTLIQLGNFGATSTAVTMIVNTDTSTGTGVTIRDLKLDGRNDRNSAGSQAGINLTGMGSESGSRAGATVTRLQITRVAYDALDITSGDHNTFTDNTIINTGGGGINVYSSSSFNTITGNTVSNTAGGDGMEIFGTDNIVSNNTATNTGGAGFYVGGTRNVVSGNTAANNAYSYGFYLDSDVDMRVTGNTASGNGNGGFDIAYSDDAVVSGNKAVSNTGPGFYVYGSNRVLVSGNTASSNTTEGIRINGATSYHSDGVTITGNVLYDNGGSGASSSITISAYASNASITDNTVSDTAGTGYAIQINATGISGTYLSGNTFSGTGATTINDAGTGTIYAGQVDSSSNYVIQPAGSIKLNANTDISGTITGGSSLTLGVASTTDGSIALYSSTTAYKVSIVSEGQTSADATITIPDTAGVDDTFCLETLGNCAASSANFIQNQNSAQQTDGVASFWIAGTGRADTSILTPLLDTAAAGTLSIGTTNATTVNVATNNANHSVNIATGTGDQAVTLGSTSGASSLTLQAGTGSLVATTGNTTGNSGAVYLKSGDSSSGVAGNISIDNGASDAGSPATAVNDDFEGCSTDDMNDWFDTTLTGHNLGAGAHGGSCVLQVAEGATYWGIQQDYNSVAVTPGEQITVSAWVKTATVSENIGGEIEWSGPAPYSSIPSVTATTTEWTQMTLTTIVPAGANYMYLTFGGTGTGSSITYFDDITIVKNQGTPAINIGTTNAESINIGHAGIDLSLQGDVVATGSLTASGGAVNLNANSNYAVNIATGTSTGTVTIGNSANATVLGSDTITVGSATGNTTIQGATQTAANTAGTSLTIQGSTGNGTGTGGAVTIKGGTGGGTNADGGAVLISGGAGTGSGVQGLVTFSTSAFLSSSTQSFGSSGSLTAGLVDQYSSVPVAATTTGVTVTVPAPAAANQVVGRVLYLANVGGEDFNILLSGTSINIALKPNSTATLIWNGTGWTAAGASSSTDLQSAYNNTLTSAGGAELVLNAPGGNADGFTIRNNGVPITGSLFEVQSSIATNLFSVNNNTTDYADNGGAEETTFTGWTAIGSTVTQNTTSSNVATGRASVSVVTTGNNQGVKGALTTSLTADEIYVVNFAAKVASGGPNTLNIYYSIDGSANSAACESSLPGTGYTSTTDFSIKSSWTKVSCFITVPSSGITSGNAIRIYETDLGSGTFYIDNLSVISNAGSTTPANVQIGGGSFGGQPTIFTLDQFAGPPMDAGNDSFLGSMYYDTTKGTIQCYQSNGWGACGSAPDDIITLTPEYTGAVLNGTGVGTLTADFCGNGGGLSVNTGFCASGEARNYYKWTSPQPTAQTYSIYVTYRLPSTFKGFVSGSTNMTGLVDSTSNAGIAYSIYRKASGGGLTSCSASKTVVGSGSGSTNTWTTAAPTTDPSSCTSFVAGDSIVFKIDVTAQSNASVYAENLTFQYSNK